MAFPTVHELISQNTRLVSLPEIVHRINSLINDPAASATDIAKTIGQDPALTARLLKIANSPLYSLNHKIDSLTDAVNLLGTRQLRDLVIANAVIQRFGKASSNAMDIETFWCHSITTGIAARVIATELRLNNTERFFIAGLLHDIGKMIMALLLPNECIVLRKTLARPGTDINTSEQQLFGFNHAQVGAELLRAWNFPDSLIEACMCHHQPEQAKKYSQEATIVHIANVIANNLQTAISLDDDTLLNQRTLKLLGITPGMLEQFHERVYQQFDEVLQTLFYDVAA